MEIEKRPYVTARRAAELLGVDESVVADDVQEGMDGNLPALIGGRYADTWIVAAFEVEGDRLELHRTRLARPDSEGIPIRERLDPNGPGEGARMKYTTASSGDDGNNG